MIPTMLLFGLVLGRWWKTALVIGAAGWALVLWTQGVVTSAPEVVGAAVLALVNTAVGVGIHQLALAGWRRARGGRAGRGEGLSGPTSPARPA